MKRIFSLLYIITVVTSCSDITDQNVDPKKPTITKAEYLFTNAQKKVVDQMVSTSVNYNVFRMFVQQWTATTYPNESQYDITGRKIPDQHFSVLYRDVLMDLKASRELIVPEIAVSASEIAIKQNKLALIEVFECYSYSVLVDTFGDVPYTQALDIKKYPLPAYDDAKTIYKDLIKRFAAAAVILKANTQDPNFGRADLVYNGDAASNAKWAKFANSMIVRLAVNISDVDQAYAATQIQAALVSGVLGSNADNTKLNYLATAGNQNPLFADLVTSKRDDFIPAEPFVAAMDAIGGDKRMDKYFVNAAKPVPVIPAGRSYVGGTYGEANVFGSYSHITGTLNNPVFPGTLFDYAELQFLLAEAAEKKLVPGGTAQAEIYYNAGIDASYADWGLTQADANKYKLLPKVAYTNTASGATWQEKIGMQSWFALYNRGFEAWTSYRRLDYPKLLPSNTSKNRGFLTVPVRYTYPGVEQFQNGTSYTKAAAAIGGDLMTTKVFWDKN